MRGLFRPALPAILRRPDSGWLDMSDEGTAIPDPPSRALVASAAAGDGAAVEALLARHLPGLRAFLRFKAGPQLLALESSSDLVQSVCRDILQNVERFRSDSEGDFRRWLFTTALRKIADRYEYYRAQKRDIAREVSTGGDDAILDACRGFHTPSRHAIAREELARLELALAALDPDKRDAIVFSRVVGLTGAELAKELRRSEVAARKLLSRALAELADRLTD